MNINNLTETRTNTVINTLGSAPKPPLQPLAVKTGRKYTVYICGKVYGEDPNECYRKFYMAQLKLYDSGITSVANPVDRVRELGIENYSWQAIMRHCIGWLMECEAIYCLPDWAQSEGAKLERFMAGRLGIEIIDGE